MDAVFDEDVKTQEDTEALGIRNGDFVCFDPRFQVTQDGYIKSHALIGADVYASRGYKRSHVEDARNTLKLLHLYLGTD